MLRVGQVKLPPDHSEEKLKKKLSNILSIPEKEIIEYHIVKKSIDARKKPDIFYVYTVDVKVNREMQVLNRQKGTGVTLSKEQSYLFPRAGEEPMACRPMIVGSGPAGLFCAYLLAKEGYRPLVFERGASVEERALDIEQFWQTGKLNTSSNVQFGEGGAGTFSDGKLNTLVKDRFGRNKKVLEIFVENGAPKEILYTNKPHIGTDVLMTVVRNMREQILRLGGEIRFHSQFVHFSMEGDRLSSIQIQTSEGIEVIPAQTLVLAIGHSARDTFTMLYENGLRLESKPFAVGVRIEHPQTLINDAQYGEDLPYKLPAASYKVATQLKNGRGVYSFCMCPGGFVVNASSQTGRLAINGMSYHAREGVNGNSAIIVTVDREDFGSSHPLAGMYFQQSLEEKAYKAGNGVIPVQTFEDFCKNEASKSLGEILPQTKGDYCLSNVREIFPEMIASSLEEGIKSFDKQIHGFARGDAIVSGAETRTSSPVKILRNESFQIENTGIYPCGEGAGYAGGITSAAMDGIKVAEKIGEKFRPFDRI